MRRTPILQLFASALLVASTLPLAGVASGAAPTVKDEAKISDEHGGFEGTLHEDDIFGSSVDGIGDLDGDGVEDIVAGAPHDDDGDFDAGAVWVLFMRVNGTVKDFTKISDIFGDFTGILHPTDEFGSDVAAIGDLDDDGIQDIAVGAPYDDDGDFDAGAVWILFMNTDGTVKNEQKISDISGDFEGILLEADNFGFAVDRLGDLDGDGVEDIAVGAPFDDDGDGIDLGAVWILFLRKDGTVKDFQKISMEDGRFRGEVTEFDTFGTSLATLGDLDGDGITDLAVGAPLDDDGHGGDTGGMWILFLDNSGTVKNQQKISETFGGFTAELDEGDWFGWTMAGLGDVDGDGVPDVAVGSPLDDDGDGNDKGAVYLLLLQPDGTVKTQQKISELEGDFFGDLDEFDVFGSSVAAIGDLDDDGIRDIAVGASGDNDGIGFNSGALWVLFMNGTPTGTDTCGDVDESGDIQSADALLALRAAVGLEACEPCRCDVDSSSTVTAGDAQRILSSAVGAGDAMSCPACG